MINGNFIGNPHAALYFQNIIKQQTKGFLLLTGPQYIGKMTLVESVLDQLIAPNYQLQDLLIIKDLSDQRIELKEINDKLTGSSHTIKVSSDDKKSDIKLPDGSVYSDLGARDIMDWLQRSPISGRKVLVMENIERMNIASSNSLLKSFEEPLDNRLIICTSSQPDSLMDTIKSRATIIQFQPVDGYVMGRPGLSRRIDNLEQYKQLAQEVEKMTSGRYSTSLISKRQAICMDRSAKGLLNLGLDLILYTQAQSTEGNKKGLSAEKIIQAKKYLESNVGVGNIMLDMVME